MELGLVGTLLSTLSHHWALVLSSLFLAYLVRNRYRNGLNKYPGPFLASLTDLWRLWDVYGQRPERTLQALHAKYGDVVRIGPNCLSFADPAVLKSIYGLNKGFVKVGYQTIHISTPAKISSPTSTLSNNPSSKATASHPSSAQPTTTSTRNSVEA